MGFLDKVKDIAGKVGDQVEKGAKSVSDSAQKMSEKSRLKREINQLTADVNNAYGDIGRRFVEENPESEAYAELIGTIKEKSAQIETLKDQLAAMDDKQTCKACGAPIAKDAKFCDKCGAKVEVIVADEPEADAPESADAKVCSNCGEALVEDAKFCEKCGTAVEGSEE